MKTAVPDAPKFIPRGIAIAIGIMFISVLGVLLVNYSPEKSNPGFDEPWYMGLASSGWLSVSSGQTGTYHAAKSMPFLVFRAIFGGVVGDAADYSTLAPYFLLFNALCLFLACIAVAKILQHLGKGDLIVSALILMIVTKAFLVFYDYYPILGDVFVFALGAALAYGVVLRRLSVQYAVLAVSAITSPQLCLFALLIIIFPNSPTPVKSNERTLLSPLLFAALVAFPIICAASAIFLVPERTVAVAEWWGNPKYFKQPAVVIAAVALAGIVLWAAALPARMLTLQSVACSISWRHILFSVLLLSLIAAIVSKSLGASGPTIGIPSVVDALLIKFSYLLSKPGPPGLLSHILFLGVAAAAVIVVWRDFSRWLVLQGSGVALGFAVMLTYFGLDGEVRHVIFLYPLIVVGLIDICSARIRKIGPVKLFVANALVSLSWLPFFYFDASYRGERHLSAFGMCWSLQHYVIAIIMSAMTFYLAWRWFRPSVIIGTSVSA